jgi:hypothetical protein
MNNTTQERIARHFITGLTFSLMAAIVYLDEDIKRGNISHYSVHSCLQPDQHLIDGRYLELQVDDCRLRVDFGLDGILFSMVEEDKLFGVSRSKPSFICTLKSIITSGALPISPATKFDMEFLYNKYKEELNND